jgi:hypothetical protein
MMILFKPWRKEIELKGQHVSWSKAFEATIFKPSMKKIMNNMNVENECKDARNAYNERRRSGQKDNALLEGFIIDDLSTNIDNLETAILNDSRLDKANNEDEDYEEDYENTDVLDTINGPEQEIVNLVAQAGLFAAQRAQNDTDNQPAGLATIVEPNDKDMLQMQSTLMSSMRADKRPAMKENEEFLPNLRRCKRRKLDPSTSLRQLEENADFVEVCSRDEASLSPEEAIELVIDDLEIRGNKEQERAVRIVGEHFVNQTEEQMGPEVYSTRK